MRFRAIGAVGVLTIGAMAIGLPVWQAEAATTGGSSMSEITITSDIKGAVTRSVDFTGSQGEKMRQQISVSAEEVAGA